jgi:hypothetical protein
LHDLGTQDACPVVLVVHDKVLSVAGILEHGIHTLFEPYVPIAHASHDVKPDLYPFEQV